MTWKELKIVTLQKVFAINDGALRDDDTTKEYLTAMPGAANEALALLAGDGHMIRRKLTVEQFWPDEDGEEPKEITVEGDVIRAPVGTVVNVYDLRKLAPEWYDIDQTFVKKDGEDTERFEMDGDWTLVLPAEEGTWTIRFYAWPKAITGETEDDYELPVYPEVATLLPLYMASQIYKDDDIAIATQYRNEFEVGREGLSAFMRNGNGWDKWKSTTNWW